MITNKDINLTIVFVCICRPKLCNVTYASYCYQVVSPRRHNCAKVGLVGVRGGLLFSGLLTHVAISPGNTELKNYRDRACIAAFASGVSLLCSSIPFFIQAAANKSKYGSRPVSVNGYFNPLNNIKPGSAGMEPIAMGITINLFNDFR